MWSKLFSKETLEKKKKSHAIKSGERMAYSGRPLRPIHLSGKKLI